MDCLTQTILAWFKEIAAKSGNAEILLDTELIEQGVLDSLEILRLVSFLEEKCGVAVPVDEFVPENFRTPKAVAILVTRLRSQAASPVSGFSKAEP